jgi:ubiquinone/menaquinone biosynthesis C-methylase UbiE
MTTNKQENELSQKILTFHQMNYQKPAPHQGIIDRKFSYFQYSRYYAVIEEIRKLDFDSFLDVGCAEGLYLITAKEKHAKCDVFGVDFSAVAMKKARFYTNNSDSFLAAADAMHLPFKNNSFDLTLCSETLEHIVDDNLAIKELARISKKTCLITVPSFNNLHAKSSFKPDLDCESDTHLRKYMQNEIKQTLTNYFQDVQIYNLSFWFLSSADIISHMFLPKGISSKISHVFSSLAGLDYRLCKAGAHGHSFICICKK